MSSPAKKKLKTTDSKDSMKREHELEASTSHKRFKSETSNEIDIQALKRKNFVTACERVSCEAYFDQQRRFSLLCIPNCSKENRCKHDVQVHEIPSYAEESFKIEIKSNMWFEALEVCFVCVTPRQYLSANVLMDVVEIMLNAHEDPYAGYTTKCLLDKCQQILSQNFTTHPPCIVKNLRKCYNNFLTCPMSQKENTFTNRSEFGCDKGIVKYCMNRLEYDVSPDSKDEALVNKQDHIPEEMKQSLKGLHWQKEKLELFELLDRQERIQRLMAVLESIIELLQLDLAIWHSRYKNNLGCHIMRSHKPLMAFVLWSNNVLYTGAVNNNCRQIMKLFVYFIHLKYPERYIRIVATWLNIMIQTFYICENNSNNDYPNVGKYCNAFANEFYRIISEVPHNSIIRILERIQPSYMQSLIATLHIEEFLKVNEDNVILLFMEFVKKSIWTKFPNGGYNIKINKNCILKPKKINRIMNYLTKKCRSWESECYTEACDDFCAKLDLDELSKDKEIDQNYIIHTFYIAIEAYLDSYNVQAVQDTLEALNNQLIQKGEIEVVQNSSSFSVTEHFIKKYRSIYQTLKELMIIMDKKKNSGQLPKSFVIFENIGF